MWLVDLIYNFEWGWLIELLDNKLSDYNLASELVNYVSMHYNLHITYKHSMKTEPTYPEGYSVLTEIRTLTYRAGLHFHFFEVFTKAIK